MKSWWERQSKLSNFNLNFTYFWPCIWFRVGSDFAGTKTYSTVCNDQNALLKTRTLKIDIKDNQSKICCRTTTVSFNVHNKDAVFLNENNVIDSGTHTRIILRPKITTTDESLRKYDPKMWVRKTESMETYKIIFYLMFHRSFRRNCYFSDEKRLKFYTKYSRSYCLDERFSNFMQKYCDCAPFYSPREWKFVLFNIIF